MYQPVSEPQEIEALIQFQLDCMDDLDCPQVDMDETVAGNYSSLRSALAECGLSMEEQLVRKFVDQSKWNHR